MLNKKVETALNDHMAKEMASSYLYLSMAAYFLGENLNGFAHWMKIQAKEEWTHAMKFFDYIHARGGRAKLESMAKPKANFESALKVVEETCEHEKKISAWIHQLYELAGHEKDFATQAMLQWFLNEQVEEEASVSHILEKLKIIPEKSSAILYLDKELGKREG